MTERFAYFKTTVYKPLCILCMRSYFIYMLGVQIIEIELIFLTLGKKYTIF